MKADYDRYIFPSRQGALQGAHIPPWLLSLGLPAEQTVLWAVLARCAGGKKSTRGFSAPRLASLVGWSSARVRTTLQRLEDAELIEREQRPGHRPVFRFLAHPRSRTADGDFWTWQGLVLAAEEDPQGGEQL
jgi:hypothetical protein